jgi:hypothetical protein
MVWFLKTLRLIYRTIGTFCETRYLAVLRLQFYPPVQITTLIVDCHSLCSARGPLHAGIKEPTTPTSAVIVTAPRRTSFDSERRPRKRFPRSRSEVGSRVCFSMGPKPRQHQSASSRIVNYLKVCVSGKPRLAGVGCSANRANSINVPGIFNSVSTTAFLLLCEASQFFMQLSRAKKIGN